MTFEATREEKVRFAKSEFALYIEAKVRKEGKLPMLKS